MKKSFRGRVAYIQSPVQNHFFVAAPTQQLPGTKTEIKKIEIKDIRYDFILGWAKLGRSLHWTSPNQGGMNPSMCD